MESYFWCIHGIHSNLKLKAGANGKGDLQSQQGLSTRNNMWFHIIPFQILKTGE